MKMNSRTNLRKLLMLAAAVALLLMALAGCNNDVASEDPTETNPVQTDAAPVIDPTDAEPEITVPEETAPEAVMGTVTHDNLNVRSNPSTDSTVLNQLDINTRVVVIEQRVVGDVTWGRISDGWINMNYVLLDGAEPEQDNEPEPDQTPDEPADTDSKDGTAGTVTASELNIRKAASADSEAVGKYVKGDKVTILEVKGNWGRTDKGWVSMKYIETEGTTETPDIGDDKETDKEATTLVTDGKTKVLGYVVIDVSSLNVRYGPGTKYDSLGSVKEGERVAYYQEKNGWLRIKNGWISKAYTEKDDPLSEDEATTLVTDKNKKSLGKVTVDVDALNVRYGPGTKYDTCGSVKEGDELDYYQEKNGWIRIKDGWISKAYTKSDKDEDEKEDKDDKDEEMVSDEKTKVLGYVVVTSTSLNGRYGPGTKYEIADKFSTGDRMAYYQKDGKWVRTKDGWVSTNYCYVEGQKGDGAGSGTVTGQDLNVRKGPGTGYKSVDKLDKGDKITILAQVKVGKTTWGYTEDGWVSMEYVKIKK